MCGRQPTGASLCTLAALGSALPRSRLPNDNGRAGLAEAGACGGSVLRARSPGAPVALNPLFRRSGRAAGLLQVRPRVPERWLAKVVVGPGGGWQGSGVARGNPSPAREVTISSDGDLTDPFAMAIFLYKNTFSTFRCE